MSTVADLDDASGGRSICRLRIPPQQLEVDDGVWRGDVNQLVKYRRPLELFGHFLHTSQHFLFVNGIVP